MAIVMPSKSREHPASFSNNTPYPSCVTLDKILSGQSPRPYTLHAFLNYLTQNHCIETLDFITDAKVYCETYDMESASTSKKDVIKNSPLVDKLWKRLMTTYFIPGSPSEINLPSFLRDQLLGFACERMPSPSPEQLSPVMNHAYESLTQDALVPFIRSFHSVDNQHTHSGYVPNTTQFCSNFDQVFSQTASSPEETNWCGESTLTLIMQVLNQAHRSPVDEPRAECVEQTQHPQVFRVKSRFWNCFKKRKSRMRLNFLKRQGS